MKKLQKFILLFILATNFSYAFIAHIGVHGGYRSFDTSTDFLNHPLYGGRSTIYLGDTVRFFNYYPVNYSIVGNNLHSITSFQIPVNAIPFDFDFDSRIENLTINYIPADTGFYVFSCIYHTNTALGHYMAGAFYVTNRPTSICGNRLVNGNTCTGIGVCSTCVGVVQNCQCATVTSPPTTNTGCSNGLVQNSTCLGTANCSSCVGIALDCACTATTTGITKNKTQTVEEEGSLYPNPASEKIRVPLRMGYKYNIYVYNQKGEEVLYKRAEYQSHIELDISTLPDGQYMVAAKYCACTTPKEGCQGANKTYRFIKITK